jgi:hypothetical protein
MIWYALILNERRLSVTPQTAEQQAGVPGRDAPAVRPGIRSMRAGDDHVSPTNVGIELSVAHAERSVQESDVVTLDAARNMF